jgi:4-amino-4-deoxy-L-arabinose transferase-like glycosyltransferase
VSRTVALAIAGITLVWLVLAFLGSPYPAVNDEVVYTLGTEALLERGALGIENGHARFGSEMLVPQWFVPGPSGLAPQYPSGYFALAAPFLAALDLRGLLLLNTAAAGGVLVLTHLLARRLFGEGRVAPASVLILALAGFMTEYAMGIWPHALAALVVLGATLAVVAAATAPPARAWRGALAAGAILGAGAMIRVDTVLIGPPLALWALIVAPRPLPLAAAGIAGLVPMLAVASWLNWAKFGIPLPITYGREGAGMAPGRFLWMIGAVLAGLALAWALRLPALARRWPALLLAGAAALAGAALALPPVADALGRIGQGAHALFWDMRETRDGRLGIQEVTGGVVLFWGLVKKSLVQSLPWLGLLAALLLARPAAGERRGLLLLVLCVALFTLPFLVTGWHGGQGNNLRYFLPVLPFLAILGALALRALAAAGPAEPRAVRLWAAGALVAAAGALFLARAAGAELRPFAQYQLPHGLFLALALATGGAVLAAPGGAAWRAAARGLAAVAFAVAFVFGWVNDPLMTQDSRARLETRERFHERVVGRAMVVSVFPSLYALRRDDALNARITFDDDGEPEIDTRLLRRVMEAGIPVLVESRRHARAVADSDPGLTTRPWRRDESGWSLHRLRPDTGPR